MRTVGIATGLVVLVVGAVLAIATVLSLSNETSWTDLDPRYSGAGRYTRQFTVPDGFLAVGRRIQLDLGSVEEIAEVRLNGRYAGTRVWAPYRLDVTDDLREGENTLEVVVTNTQANEIENRALASGLLGPVALRPERVVDVPLRAGTDVQLYLQGKLRSAQGVRLGLCE